MKAGILTLLLFTFFQVQSQKISEIKKLSFDEKIIGILTDNSSNSVIWAFENSKQHGFFTNEYHKVILNNAEKILDFKYGKLLTFENLALANDSSIIRLYSIDDSQISELCSVGVNTYYLGGNILNDDRFIIYLTDEGEFEFSNIIFDKTGNEISGNVSLIGRGIATLINSKNYHYIVSYRDYQHNNSAEKEFLLSKINSYNGNILKQIEFVSEHPPVIFDGNDLIFSRAYNMTRVFDTTLIKKWERTDIVASYGYVNCLNTNSVAIASLDTLFLCDSNNGEIQKSFPYHKIASALFEQIGEVNKLKTSVKDMIFNDLSDELIVALSVNNNENVKVALIYLNVLTFACKIVEIHDGNEMDHIKLFTHNGQIKAISDNYEITLK